MSKGNVAKVEADAERIAERLMDDATITGLTREYRVGYKTLMRTLRKHLTEEQIARARYRNLVRGGRRHRFKKGHATWNKGMKGWCPPGSAATQFKPGHIRGAAARKLRAIGAIVIRYAERRKWSRSRKRPQRRFIKVRDDGKPQHQWIPLARYLWERAYGPIPPGMFVVHIDGDSLNDVLSNFRMVDRQGHIALQRKRDPGHEERRCKGAAKSAALRHQTNRELRKLIGPVTTVWECQSCGGEAESRICPERCPKCGSSCYAKLSRRAAG